MTLIVPLFISNSWADSMPPNVQQNCTPIEKYRAKACGTFPAFMAKNPTELARAFGFDVVVDSIQKKKTENGNSLFQSLVNFLEKSDRAPLFYPEYFTRATEEASSLTVKSHFVPKNVTEVDEYFRCTIPTDKFNLYKLSLRPYIALAAKSSKIDFSFLACQSYVESRFDGKARSQSGAIGYSQIRPSNIEYLNQILRLSLKNSSERKIASLVLPREIRINKVQQNIAEIWKEFWIETRKPPRALKECNLTCHQESFLAQALSIKTDMLAFATSANGITADFDEKGDFRIEKMDKGDSLLLLAGSYNVGVTKMIRLISQFCKNSTALKGCLDAMKTGTQNKTKERGRYKDVLAIINYTMRIRDCSQKYSAEKIDFDDDDRWTTNMRAEQLNQQRDRVVQCLLNPCPYSKSVTF